jgi:hypothetical protein
VIEELAITAETQDQARDLVATQLRRAEHAGIRARGLVLTSIGDHAAAGRELARHCDAVRPAP